jgi:hypothetical protein
MTDKLKKIIVKIIDKKKGVKLAELAKYLESKTTEIEGLGNVNLTTVKNAVIGLFAEGRIDIIEYKLPGDDEKNRIFCIPKGTSVTYSEHELPEWVAPEPIVEVKTILPTDLFVGFVVISDDSADFLDDAVSAQAEFMDKAVKRQSPRLYGAVPITLQIRALLETVQDTGPINVQEVTTVTLPDTGTDTALNSAEDLDEVIIDTSAPSASV